MPRPQKTAVEVPDPTSLEPDETAQQREVAGWLKVVNLALSVFLKAFRAFK